MTHVGKIRRLQQCATPDGKFVMLALDHRNNLRRSLNPADPDNVTGKIGGQAPFGERDRTQRQDDAEGRPAKSDVP